MAKISKAEYAEVKKQSNELLKLILRKTGTTLRSIHELAEDEFVTANLDVVTPTEKKRFGKLVFGL